LAVVLPDLFRIQPFVGLAQLIKLIPTEHTSSAWGRSEGATRVESQVSGNHLDSV
jgi:hypothetical protein